MEKRSQEEPAKQQQEETGETSSSVRYKGVRMRKWGKWVAEVRLPNSRERIWLGSYETPEKAARAYDAAVFCLRGPTATFNFPDSRPEIPSGRMLTSEQIRDVARRYAYEAIAQKTPSQDPTPVSEPPVTDWRKVVEETPWNPDLSAFGSAEFDEFPVGRFFPEEDDGQNEDDDPFYHPSPLWNF